MVLFYSIVRSDHIRLAEHFVLCKLTVVRQVQFPCVRLRSTDFADDPVFFSSCSGYQQDCVLNLILAWQMQL